MNKYNKAEKLSNTGKYPRTFQTIWNAIPDNLKADLTGKQLAQVMDLMQQSATHGESRNYGKNFGNDLEVTKGFSTFESSNNKKMSDYKETLIMMQSDLIAELHYIPFDKKVYSEKEKEELLRKIESLQYEIDNCNE